MVSDHLTQAQVRADDRMKEPQAGSIPGIGLFLLSGTSTPRAAATLPLHHRAPQRHSENLDELLGTRMSTVLYPRLLVISLALHPRTMQDGVQSYITRPSMATLFHF